jgi:hypothetical protein
MNLEHIFLLLWAVALIALLSFKIYKGKKALRLIPNEKGGQFEYSENSVSGFCTNGSSWRHCQARKILRIRVTEDEFWITAHPLIAHILKEQDQLKRIPFTHLISGKSFDKSISIVYKTSSRVNSFELITKNNLKLIQLLKSKITEQKLPARGYKFNHGKRLDLNLVLN